MRRHSLPKAVAFPAWPIWRVVAVGSARYGRVPPFPPPQDCHSFHCGASRANSSVNPCASASTELTESTSSSWHTLTARPAPLLRCHCERNSCCHESAQTMTKDEGDAARKSFRNKARTLSGCNEVSSNRINSCRMSNQVRVLEIAQSSRDKRQNTRLGILKKKFVRN